MHVNPFQSIGSFLASVATHKLSLNVVGEFATEIRLRFHFLHDYTYSTRTLIAMSVVLLYFWHNADAIS